MTNTLCCCEYINSDGERSHIVECCCNCVELDICFERLIRCQKSGPRLLRRLMSTASDRARLPWPGGARHCSLPLLLPPFLLPLFLLAAAQGPWLSVLLFSFLPIFITYLHFIFMKFYFHTPFFLVWNISSFLCIFLVFEIIGVILLEIRHDENFVFILLTMLVLFSVYKVKEKANRSHVSCEYEADSKVGLLCADCDLRVPPRTFHCRICQVCVMRRDQHCAWLNCCIGSGNEGWFMVYLLTSLAHLLFCSNLILTTACHPFRIFGSLMLPDDCTDVYYDPLYALCFVTALYCLEAALFVLSVILLEVWLISLGITGQEFRNRPRHSFFCGLCSPRPYSRGFFNNWIHYIKGNESYSAYYNI